MGWGFLQRDGGFYRGIALQHFIRRIQNAINTAIKINNFCKSSKTLIIIKTVISFLPVLKT